MSFRPIPPLKDIFGAGINDDDSSSIRSASNSTTLARKDPAKWMWCETQWVSLSLQAKNLGLPRLPYFDPDTMILSKEVNARMWKQLVSIEV